MYIYGLFFTYLKVGIIHFLNNFIEFKYFYLYNILIVFLCILYAEFGFIYF